ncbi:PH domain-containing protein [Geodermatophilus sp. DSM 45219]|uniref:PH domain-containing protein n=1 Tax=Geodermatophilus sp. DSM 45219 TaxID=1881103 RepID=UPI000884E7DA|nr:PH domain-containing protein [Geodermatophilus sp. DSM 45219]SDO04763.1 PH domain-containing protein [Geodermatophilus sp. DSM 45219]
MEWSPRGGGTAALAALGVVLGGAAVLLDPLGRVLVGAAAVLLLALAARDRLLRPRLAAGPAGVAVRRLTGTTELPWARLQVRVRDTRRLGVRSRLLELDTAAGTDDGGRPRPEARREPRWPRPEARPELARGERDGVLPEEDGVLVLLGRRDLGADPDEVARALRALRPW